MAKQSTSINGTKIKLTTAIRRLQDARRRAVKAGDERLAFSIDSKIIDLQGLMQGPGEADASIGPSLADLTAELALIRSYLEPLGLGDADTPTAELARRAAAKVVL